MGQTEPESSDERSDADAGLGFTSLSYLMSAPTRHRRRDDDLGDLPDHDDFEQYITQADVDRDPFAVALFEVKPIDIADLSLRRRIGQTLLQFASPTNQVAYLGRNRFGLLSLTDDTTQRWVAPVATALRATLDCWWAEESSYAAATARGIGRARSPKSSPPEDVSPIDVSLLGEQPTLMTGVARGLSREVWVNAERALARAYKHTIPVAEYHQTDKLRDGPGPTPPNRLVEPTDVDADPSTTGRAPLPEPVTATSDERLVVLARRIEPVDRHEPIWHWLRLIPGLRTLPENDPAPIRLSRLGVRDQALIEVWLANQVPELFANASAQLRVSIPLSAEACRTRSFAQRIFPLLERHRVPPSRLVVEVDMSAISRSDSVLTGPMLSPTTPSVQRFIRDAAAVNVGVAVSGFNGGWSAWYNLGDLPVDHLMPSPEMMFQAALGDNGAIRSLVLLAAEADDRGIELVAPRVDAGLSVHAMIQLGFAYSEGPLTEAIKVLPERLEYTTKRSSAG